LTPEGIKAAASSGDMTFLRSAVQRIRESFDMSLCSRPAVCLESTEVNDGIEPPTNTACNR
jgi:hypothetical protein